MVEIVAGQMFDLPCNPGELMVIDIGFSRKRRTCGVWYRNELRLKFLHELSDYVVEEAGDGSVLDLNLVVEAPLSMAKLKSVYPVGRWLDGDRNWFERAGAVTLFAAKFFLEDLQKKPRVARRIRLFEGFLAGESKEKDLPNGAEKCKGYSGNSHKQDALRLRFAACDDSYGEWWDPKADTKDGVIISPVVDLSDGSRVPAVIGLRK